MSKIDDTTHAMNFSSTMLSGAVYHIGAATEALVNTPEVEWKPAYKWFEELVMLQAKLNEQINTISKEVAKVAAREGKDIK